MFDFISLLFADRVSDTISTCISYNASAYKSIYE